MVPNHFWDIKPSPLSVVKKILRTAQKKNCDSYPEIQLNSNPGSKKLS